MSFTKDGITYPQNFFEVIKDKRINKAFVSHCKEVSGYENVQFMLIDFDPEIHFRKFIADNAPSYVNLSSATRRPMVYLADQQNWALADWRDPVKTARSEIFRLLDSNNLARTGEAAFFASKRFDLIHMSEVKKAEGTAPPPAKTFINVAKMVGYNHPLDILDPRYSDDKAMVEMLLFHDSRGDTPKAKNLLAQLKKRVEDRNENKEVYEDSLTVEAAFRTAEMQAQMEAAEVLPVDDPGNYEIAVDLDKKRLGKLEFGFETDKKSLQILNAMVNFYVQGEQPEAKKAFELLKKRYVKDHPIHMATVKTIILALKRGKLIDSVRPG